MLEPARLPQIWCVVPYDKIRRMRRILLALLMSMLLAGCTLPGIAVPASRQPSGTVLYKEDFSSPASGWDHTQYAQGIMDYDSGGYRMLINAPLLNFWSSPHKDFTDVRVEADAGKLGGPDENRIGLICRSVAVADGMNYYFLIITSDGYYGLGLFKDKVATLLEQEMMERSTAIRQGLAINHLRLDCNGDSISGYVNGFELAQVHDSTLTHGDVGLLAGTFKQPGADIVFDNFVVFAP
jgi:hypothetical protein